MASDVGIDEQYLASNCYPTQETLNSVSNWTKDNLMKMNESKCKYMIFSRSKSKFATRLRINDINLEKVPAMKLLGVWVSEDMTWSRNCQEICIKAYSRLSMLTKLKYVGVKIEDLIDIYILYIRSVAEYCSVAFHSSLTQSDTIKLERIQKTCLKVILGDMFVDYSSALEMCGLESLNSRREKRCLKFSLKAMKHTKNNRLFPINTRIHGQSQIAKEHVQVNWARTDTYRISAIPFCQRLLNQHFRDK